VAPGGTRVIEYQGLSWADLDRTGDLPALVKEAMGNVLQVGILRCVTEGGGKVTLAGEAEVTRELVRSGAASTQAGIAIMKKDFPVILRSWPYRIRGE